MRVTVRLSGDLATRLGSRRRFDLGDTATVAELLDLIGREAGVGLGATRTLAVVAGGTVVPPTHELADGDELDVLVPVAGG